MKNLPLFIRNYTRPGENGCIEWIGSKFTSGYGQLRFLGKIRRAHRVVAYLLFNTQLDDRTIEVMHTCDNKPCVNPDHLKVGTHKENMRDASVRKRWKTKPREFCKHGHPLSGDNLYLRHSITQGRDIRECKTCRNLASKMHNVIRKYSCL